MDKQEFLDRLRLALSGNVSARLVEENVKYYEGYINTQSRLGYPEAEILSSLGDPRLIAKSIIMANDGSFSDNTSGSSRNHSEDLYNTEYYAEKRNNNALRIMNMPRWLVILLVILVVLGIISVVTSVISALLPFAVPIIIIYFLVKLFRDWLN